MTQFKNNGKLKLLIIVGTRPEIIRLAAVINKCRNYFDCLLAHTGQNYDYNLNGVFFKDLKLADPDIYMEAEVSVIYHTFIETCKMCGVSTLEYFKEFFKAIMQGRTDYESSSSAGLLPTGLKNMLPMTIGIKK